MGKLEKILNSIKSIVPTKKGILIYGVIGLSLFGWKKVIADNGGLRIYNVLSSEEGSNHVDIVRRPDGATENPNDPGKDFTFNSVPAGSGIYSYCKGIALRIDARPEDSNTPFDVKLTYSGTLSQDVNNWLEFSFPISSTFGNQPIIFQQTSSSDDPNGTNKFYPVYDVRRAMDPNNGNNGVVPLEKLTVDDYGTDTVYGDGDLQIGTRLLADLTNEEDGKVDLRDYAVLAQDFGRGPGQYIGDISGPNGIPDGYVDIEDLSAFSEDYLKDANDPNTW